MQHDEDILYQPSIALPDDATNKLISLYMKHDNPDRIYFNAYGGIYKKTMVG